MEPVPFQLRIVANKEEKEKNGVLETFMGGSSFSMFSTAAFLVNCGFVELLKLSWLVHLVCVHTAALLKWWFCATQVFTCGTQSVGGSLAVGPDPSLAGLTLLLQL